MNLEAMAQGVIRLRHNSQTNQFYIVGQNEKALGLVDRLKFYEAGNPAGLAKGWYVERGRPDDESTYKLVYRRPGVPLQVKSGDVLYTAQGKGKTDFALRHAVFVHIEGRKISLWGAYETEGPEQKSKSGVLYLNLPNQDAAYDRRIVIQLWRFD